MKRLGLALGILVLVAAAPASAQTVVLACQSATPIYAAGQQNRLYTVDVYGNLCQNGAGGGSGGGAVTVSNLNPNGQAAMAASSPVVIASDQSALAVVGNAADGATDSGASVKIGGQVNTTGGQTALTSGQRSFWWMGARGSGATFLTALNGNPVADVAVTSVDAVSNALGALKVQSLPYAYNGTTWDRAPACQSSAVVSVTNGTTGQIVALAASQVVRVCSLVLTSTAATTATVVYGTGALCATGQVALTGAMALGASASGISISGGSNSILRGASANAICLTAGATTVTGFLTYSQY